MALPSLSLSGAPLVALPRRDLLYAAYEPDDWHTANTPPFFGMEGNPQSNNNSDGTVGRWRNALGDSSRDLVVADTAAPGILLRHASGMRQGNELGYSGYFTNYIRPAYDLRRGQGMWPVLLCPYTDKIGSVYTDRYPKLAPASTLTISADTPWAVCLVHLNLGATYYTNSLITDNFGLGFLNGPGVFTSGPEFGYWETDDMRTYGWQSGKPYCRTLVNVPGTGVLYCIDGVAQGGFSSMALANPRFDTALEAGGGNDSRSTVDAVYGMHIWAGSGVEALATPEFAMACTDAWADYLWGPSFFYDEHGDSNTFGFLSDSGYVAPDRPRAADTESALIESYLQTHSPAVRCRAFGISGAQANAYSDARGWPFPTRLRGKGVVRLKWGTNDIRSSGVASYSADAVYSLQKLGIRLRARGLYVIADTQLPLSGLAGPGTAEPSLNRYQAATAWNALVKADKVGAGGAEAFDDVIPFDEDAFLWTNAGNYGPANVTGPDGLHYGNGGHKRRAEIALPVVLKGLRAIGAQAAGGGGGGNFAALGIGL